MKKIFSVLALAALVLLSACEPIGNLPEEGATYPRVQLLEHFTGADCGYCPAGMDYIYEEYSKNQDGIVWVSNHYGFGTDEYTVSESAKVGKKLGVSGAPNISLNREQYTLEGTKSRAYHPYYTSQVLKKTAKEATEKVEIVPSYDAASRKLTLTVKGETSRKDLAGVMLTVVLTESGMQGRQQDYNDSWEGWTKFTHTHAVRKYLSEALGDDVLFVKQRFETEYEVTLDSKWVAENCQVAAWITELDMSYPVLNAAKAVVVPGSKGGEDIKHGGVEAKAVPATYPENGAPVADMVLDVCEGSYKAQGEYTVFNVSAMGNTSVLTSSAGRVLYPYFDLIILAPAGATTLPLGEYPIVPSGRAAANTVIAGERDDVNFEFNYSAFYYVFSQNNSLYINDMWLLQSGTVTVTADGMTIQATSLNGSAINATYTGAMSFQAGAPARQMPARHE